MTTTLGAILVVDDNAAIRRVLSAILKREGYDVLEAGSGREALDLYAQNAAAIRLLVTDVEMPKMRGPELAVALSRLGCSSPVLYISGYHSEAPVAAAKAVDIRFLKKPVAPVALIETVTQLISSAARPA